MNARNEQADEVLHRYARRDDHGLRYSMLNAAQSEMVFERQRATLRLFRELGLVDLHTKRVVEVGCGSGGNLIDLIRWGFRAENLIGVDLIQERVSDAVERLPSSVTIHLGDALSLDIAPRSMDIVYQALVFSSLLDNEFQLRLAQTMWSWLRPGGGVLWYDFTWDNPYNPDVRGVPLKRVAELFPEGRIRSTRITLAPPIARRAADWHPSLYGMLNTMPFLRTHLLCWIERRH